MERQVDRSVGVALGQTVRSGLAGAETLVSDAVDSAGSVVAGAGAVGAAVASTAVTAASDVTAAVETLGADAAKDVSKGVSSVEKFGSAALKAGEKDFHAIEKKGLSAVEKESTKIAEEGWAACQKMWPLSLLAGLFGAAAAPPAPPGGSKSAAAGGAAASAGTSAGTGDTGTTEDDDTNTADPVFNPVYTFATSTFVEKELAPTSFTLDSRNPKNALYLNADKDYAKLQRQLVQLVQDNKTKDQPLLIKYFAFKFGVLEVASKEAMYSKDAIEHLDNIDTAARCISTEYTMLMKKIKDDLINDETPANGNEKDQDQKSEDGAANQKNKGRDAKGEVVKLDPTTDSYTDFSDEYPEFFKLIPRNRLKLAELADEIIDLMTSYIESLITLDDLKDFNAKKIEKNFDNADNVKKLLQEVVAVKQAAAVPYVHQKEPPLPQIPPVINPPPLGLYIQVENANALAWGASAEDSDIDEEDDEDGDPTTSNIPETKYELVLKNNMPYTLVQELQINPVDISDTIQSGDEQEIKKKLSYCIYYNKYKQPSAGDKPGDKPGTGDAVEKPPADSKTGSEKFFIGVYERLLANGAVDTNSLLELKAKNVDCTHSPAAHSRSKCRECLAEDEQAFTNPFELGDDGIVKGYPFNIKDIFEKLYGSENDVSETKTVYFCMLSGLNAKDAETKPVPNPNPNPYPEVRLQLKFTDDIDSDDEDGDDDEDYDVDDDDDDDDSDDDDDDDDQDNDDGISPSLKRLLIHTGHEPSE